MTENSTNVELKTKKDATKKRKNESSIEKIQIHAEVHEDRNGANVNKTPDLASSLQQGFAQMSKELSKAICESFKEFRSEFEVEQVDEGEHEEHDSHDAPEALPPKRHKQGAELNDNSASSGNLDEAVAKLKDASNSKKSEGDFEVLNSLKQDLKKEETGLAVNTDLASVVNAMLKDGLPEEKLQEKLNKYHRPENCESLTKVRVNQAVWDNLTPSIRSQDVKLQKVQTSMFKGMCALTSTIDSVLQHMALLPKDNDLLQKSTDALALFANANNELNQRRRELIKPDLHEEYKHLCSSSLEITDQLFGDDLPKQVKELTEVNRVGKKVSTSARSASKPDFNKHSFGRNRPRYNGNQRYSYRRPFLGSGKNDYKNHSHAYKKKREGKQK